MRFDKIRLAHTVLGMLGIYGTTILFWKSPNDMHPLLSMYAYTACPYVQPEQVKLVVRYCIVQNTSRECRSPVRNMCPSAVNSKLM